MPRPEPIPSSPRGSVNFTAGSIKGPAGLVGATSFTVTMWIIFTATAGDWALWINTNGSTYTGMGTSTGADLAIFTGFFTLTGLIATPVIGRPYFVAVAGTGTTLTGYVLTRGAPLTVVTAGSLTGNAADVVHISDDGLGSGPFPGTISNQKIWSRALSQAEILAESVQGAPVSYRGILADVRLRNKGQAFQDQTIQAPRWTLSSGSISNSLLAPPVPDILAPAADDDDASSAAAAPSLFFFPDAPVIARPSPIQVVSALGPLPIPNPTPTPLEFFELARRAPQQLSESPPGPVKPPTIATIVQPLVNPDAPPRPRVLTPSPSPIAPVPERTSPLVAAMVEPPRPATPVAYVRSSQAIQEQTIQEQTIPLGRAAAEPPPRSSPPPSPTFALSPQPERASPLVAAMNEPPRPGAPTPSTGSTAAIQEQRVPLGRVEPEAPGRSPPTPPAAFSLGPAPEQPVALAAHQHQPEPPRSSVSPGSTATAPGAPERTAIAPLSSAPDRVERSTPPDARSSIGPAPERKIVLIPAAIDSQPPRPIPTPLSPSSLGPLPLPSTVPVMVYTAPEQLPRSVPSPLSSVPIAPKPIPNPPLSTTAVDPPRPGLPTAPAAFSIGPRPLPNPTPTPSWAADPPTSRPSLTSAGAPPIPFVPPASFLGAFVPPPIGARELRQAFTETLLLLTPALPSTLAMWPPRALEQRSSTASAGAPERTLPILPAGATAPTPSPRMLDVQAPEVRPPSIVTLPGWIDRAAASGVRGDSITWTPVPIAPPTPAPLAGATWFSPPPGSRRDELWWLSPLFFDGTPPPIVVTNNPATVGLTSSALASIALTQSRLATVKLTDSRLATVALSHSTLTETGS